MHALSFLHDLFIKAQHDLYIALHNRYTRTYSSLRQNKQELLDDIPFYTFHA